jgi:FimV-like protein
MATAETAVAATGAAAAVAAVATPAVAASSRKHTAAADEIDAISEADLFLNYGRDQQAEDLLNDALQKTPGNIPIQLKLLSIYASRKDLNKFTTIARQIKDSGDNAAWEQTCVMGRAVDEGNPMYGEAPAAESAAPAAIAEPAATTPKPLDMDVGFNIPMDMDITSAAPAPQAEADSMDFDVSTYNAVPAMDLDVTGAHEPAALLPDFDVTGGHQVAAAPGMDLDITGSHPNVVAAAGMDFDVTGSHPNVVASSSMDFDVTGSHPMIAAAEAVPGANMSTVVLEQDMEFGAAPALAAAGGMDFDLSAASAAPALDFGSAAPASVSMDFDISAAPAAPPAAISPEPADGSLNFDLGSFSAPAPAAAPAPATVEEAPSSLGGLDFDITGSHPLVTEEAPAANMSTVVLNEPMDLNVATAPADETPAELGGLDFNVTGDQGADANAEASAGLGGLDFNVTGDQPASTAAAPEDIKSTLVLNAPMDFDVSAPSPAAEGSLNFDLSSSQSVVLPSGSGSEAAALGGGMDFDLSAPQAGAKTEPVMDLSGISLDVSAGEGKSVADTVVFPAAEPAAKDDRWQDVQNKLELATAFLEGMGDADTARELLGEVLNEGDAQQVESARALIQKI